MRRIGIYVIYDKEGIIDDYIKVVLENIKKEVDYLVVVCNFLKIEKGADNIGCADKFILRNNIGYDAGAYKDVLLEMKEFIIEYDELIISNDTYFGPIRSFSEMFIKMSVSNCDYWGITKHPGGIDSNRKKYNEHIQSYFICYKSKVLHDDRFWNYWKMLLYSDNINDVILSFEIGLNDLLTNIGYIGDSYVDNNANGVHVDYNQNPYINHLYDLVCFSNMPIIKRKCFEIDNNAFGQALDVVEFLEQKKLFDIRLIKNHLLRINSPNGLIPTYNFREMEDFVCKFQSIYIYGNGLWGNNLFKYFKYKKWNFKGFIVSSRSNNQEESIDDTIINLNEGIIIAVRDPIAVDNIHEVLAKKVNSTQIFEPINIK